MEGSASEVEPRTGWSRRQTVAAYAVAGAGYIILGGFFKEVFAWWTYGAAFALVAICGVPAVWRRLR